MKPPRDWPEPPPRKPTDTATFRIKPPPLAPADRAAQIEAGIDHITGQARILADALAERREWRYLAHLASRLQEASSACRDRLARYGKPAATYPATEG